MSLQVLKLNNNFIIKQEKSDDFFIISNNSIIISIFYLAALLKFLLFREMLSPKVLQGIVDEYYSYKENSK